MADRIEIKLPFPVNGVDKSMPPGHGLPLTTRDAMNVEGVPPGTLYLGGGRRGGHDKAFQNAIGQDDAGPPGKTITGGIVAVRAWNQLVAQEGNYVNVEDNFSTYPTQLSIPNAGGGYDGVAIGTDFRGEYTAWAKNPAQAYATPDPSTTTGSIFGGAGAIFPTAPFSPFLYGSFPPFLYCRSAPVSASSEYILGINYHLATSVKATILVGLSRPPYGPLYKVNGDRGASYGQLLNGQCTQIGPIFKASENFGNFLCAYLEATSENVVRLVIETHIAGTVTKYPSANSFPLSLAFVGYNDSTLTIEASWNSSAVRARVVWPDQNIDDTVIKTTTDIAAIGSGGTLETTSRGGLIFRHTTFEITRFIKSMAYTKIVPITPTVIATVNASDVDQSSAHFQVPKGLDSIYVTDTIVAGYQGDTAPYLDNATTYPSVNWPMFDRIGVSPASGAVAVPQIYGGTTAGVGEGGVYSTPQPKFRAMYPSIWRTDATVAALAEVPDIELTFTGSDGTIDDGVGAILSLSGIDGTY